MNTPKHPAENWRPLLNVMARLDMELDIARTCQFEPTTLCIGRKEMYELKRDWREWLAEQPDGTLRVRGLLVQVVDATSELFLR